MWKVEINRNDDSQPEVHEGVTLKMNQFARSDRGYGYGEDALQITKDGEHITTVGFRGSVGLHETYSEEGRKFTFNDLGFVATGYELTLEGKIAQPGHDRIRVLEVVATNVQ